MGIIGTLRSLPRRIRDSIEQEGLPSFALRIVLWRAYRAGVVLAKPLAPRAGQAGVQVRVASADDVLAHLAVRGVHTPQMLQSRLHHGQECTLALIDGTIAAHRWVVAGTVRMPHLGLLLDLCEDEIFSYDLYVLPGFRGRGITATATHTFDSPYVDRGFRTEVSCATMGRRPWGKGGRANAVATIRVLRLGPLRKFWVKTHGPQAEYWRERLKELRWA